VAEASGVWKTFKAHVDRRPIRIVYETRASDFVQDPDTLEVFGLLAEHGGRTVAIKARRAVVMCTGGFEANLDMQRDYWGLDRVYTFGTPANTGDGVKMLQKAGADMWHMRNSVQGAGFYAGVKVPGFQLHYANLKLQSGSWLELARDDCRFYDESGGWSSYHDHMPVHGRWVDVPLPHVLPVHRIFDEHTRRSEPIAVPGQPASWSYVVEGYRWSDDNSVEIEKGWIAKAGSIRELAAVMGRDPDAVEAAVMRFNASAAEGRDLDFGREPRLMRPLSEPPFYAVELVPGIVSTTGGGRRNARSQVLSHTGLPIPRLYEAGELGSTLANLYENGCHLTECMVFGRIAGWNAAREPDWLEAAVPVV
jgi:hypothetical protein